MHYYQFHIGDYASHTRHLSLIEDLAYRRLLDAYYLQERPLNSGIASVARQIGMKEHETEVAFVLESFFSLTPEGWANHRADQEIEHFCLKIQQASRAGKASAERRLNARSADVQPTINHKPRTNIKTLSVSKPEGVSEVVWQEFVKHRQSKKASISDLVLTTIAKQASEAGWTLEQALTEMVSRGWQGFKADWVKSKQTVAAQQLSASDREKARLFGR